MQLFHYFSPSPKGICFKFKPLDPEDCTLQSQRIDIWQIPLNILFNQMNRLLNEAETERAAKYYFDRHRRRFSIARATLRMILAQYLQKQAANQLIFTENKYGKPFLRDYPEVTFNLSHSQDLALLVVGKNHPIGIDLEFFSGRPYQGIGAQLFSDKENLAFEAVKYYAKSLSFFHIWSQKEAFIKACGLGLSYPTKSFDVSPLSACDLQIADKQHNTIWNMTSFMPQVACSAAVCYHPDIKEIRYIALTPSAEN